MENILLFHKLFSQLDVDYQIMMAEPIDFNQAAKIIVDALERE
jgi:hypothetical protein